MGVRWTWRGLIGLKLLKVVKVGHILGLDILVKESILLVKGILDLSLSCDVIGSGPQN